MVFSGLKDFHSYIPAAPSNRINIKSFLKIHTNQIFKEALIREKSRGGQSFIIYKMILKKLKEQEKLMNYYQILK